MNTTSKKQSPKRHTIHRLFFILLIAYIATASGRIDSGDGQAIFTVSQNLLDNQSVTMPPPDPDLIAFDARGRPLGNAAELGIEDGSTILGRDGNYYSPYGLGHSLFILPLLLVGKLIAWLFSSESPQWTMQFVTAMFFNPLVSAASGVLLYLTALRLSFGAKKSLILAILYAFGTMTWVYAKSFFSDPLIAFFLLAAFYGLLSYREEGKPGWLWFSGAALGLMVLTKPAALINIPIFALYLLFLLRKESWPDLVRPALIFALPIVVGVGGAMAYNWWRFESMFDTGYRNIGWNFPFWLGLYGLVASPGKGFLLYNPILIAALIGLFWFYRQHRPETWLMLGVVAINLLFLATYDHWHGGGSWGPRLILPLIPLLILPLGSLLQHLPPKGWPNLLLALLIMVSVMIQIPGLSVNYARFLQRVYSLSVDHYYHRVTFQVAYSPLLGQWLEMREVVGNLRDPAIRANIAQAAFSENESASAEQMMGVLSTNLPDFWFVYLPFIVRGG